MPLSVASWAQLASLAESDTAVCSWEYGAGKTDQRQQRKHYKVDRGGARTSHGGCGSVGTAAEGASSATELRRMRTTVAGAPCLGTEPWTGSSGQRPAICPRTASGPPLREPRPGSAARTGTSQRSFGVHGLRMDGVRQRASAPRRHDGTSTGISNARSLSSGVASHRVQEVLPALCERVVGGLLREAGKKPRVPDGSLAREVRFSERAQSALESRNTLTQQLLDRSDR